MSEIEVLHDIYDTSDGSHCASALNLAGRHYPCQLRADHQGWGHSNRDVEAIWVE